MNRCSSDCAPASPGCHVARRPAAQSGAVGSSFQSSRRSPAGGLASAAAGFGRGRGGRGRSGPPSLPIRAEDPVGIAFLVQDGARRLQQAAFEDFELAPGAGQRGGGGFLDLSFGRFVHARADDARGTGFFREGDDRGRWVSLAQGQVDVE